jgi:predicted hotdog family 3-hydroxylacyl-ACP dehydratase
VLEIWRDGIRCRGRVPLDHPSVTDGAAGSWMALELAAQAAGLLQAAGERATEPRVGYVVRLRDARFRRPTLPAAAPLLATVELEGSGGPLSLYRASIVVEGDDTPLAGAILGTFLPPAPG